MPTVAEIVNEAQVAARQAAEEFLAKHGEPMFCGFAWTKVYVDRTNSQEAKALIAAGFQKDCCEPKCLSWWNPSGLYTQSMDVKEAGAEAFTTVLRKYGFRAYSGSRPD